jgi:hypothetical protein
MTFAYETIVPWGRTFDEYQRMFNLSERDLGLRIFGCGDGPAAFNAQLSQRGGRIVSCDPLYQFTSQQIRERIDVTYQNVIEQTRRDQSKFVWDAIPSVDALGKIRMAAMTDFLADYEQGKTQGRYVCGAAPSLPFAPNSFDLALSSHFLFLYSDNLSLEFHQQSIAKLLQIAAEVRIFPLLTYNAEISPYLEPVCESLTEAGFKVAIEPVPYEFQRGGNQMLQITKQKPQL